MSETAEAPTHTEVKPSSNPASNGNQEGSSRISFMRAVLEKVKRKAGGVQKEPENYKSDKAAPIEASGKVVLAISEEKPKTPGVSVDVLEKTEKGNELIRQETINDMTNMMRGLPRLSMGMSFQIPWRTERQTPIEVFDEKTGLVVEAAYSPDKNMHSTLRTTPGLTLILSTPELRKGEDHAEQLDKMSAALKEIYGESETVDGQMQGIRYLTDSDRSTYDRVKFELFVNEGGPVLNDFAPTTGKDRVPINRWETSPKRPVTESGGRFLRGLIERAVQKQRDEAEKIKSLTAQAIEKVKDEAVPNDPTKVYEYAYHSTYRSNISGISESGLQPSGSGSKEPGTIFFTGWDSATVVQPENDQGVVYRFQLQEMPDIARSWFGNGKWELRGIGHSIPTETPIPSEKLDFSLDSGKTWMPVVSKREASELKKSQ